jgi:5-methyltetrahydrofolate--homocysteine methyltransferase
MQDDTLHDIGKNLVAMIVEGGGWEVIDSGVDVSAQKFIDAQEKYPKTKVLVGGAPLTSDFAAETGAD